MGAEPMQRYFRDEKLPILQAFIAEPGESHFSPSHA